MMRFVIAFVPKGSVSMWREQQVAVHSMKSVLSAIGSGIGEGN
jgi:hypothetical protein